MDFQSLARHPQNSTLTIPKVFGFCTSKRKGFYLLGKGIVFEAERKKGIARG